jgi:DNA polymerase-3 subunit gamma/tau
VSHAFYRKWRPRTFSEVVGQEHVTQTLQNAVRSSRIVHAYLFSGPRGTGKTSTARILAKAVNCLADTDSRPCNACERCQAIDEGRAIDLIEIDAASHTGVDDIRELRDKISFSPSVARYKCYIIDEVHMLSPSAFNALLKTLEEPPAHAILVLATTEPHKIPGTVLSRCQRFDFRPIPLQTMIDRLREIALREELKVHEGALELIARQSTGSMRDAESYLDQLASYGGSEITLDQVHSMLGTTSSEAVRDLVDHLATRDVAAGLSTIGLAIADGADPRQLNKELLGYLRGLLLLKTTQRGPSDVTEEQAGEMVRQAELFSLDRLVLTIKVFNQAALEVKGSSQPQLPLELAFVETVIGDETSNSPRAAKSAASSGKSSAAAERPSTATSGGTSSPPPSNPPPEPAAIRETAPEERPRPGQAGRIDGLEGLQDAWGDIVAEIKRTSKRIAAIATDCPPVMMEDDTLTLCARSTFHKQEMESTQAKQLVADVVSEALGKRYRVRCITTAETPKRDGVEKDLQQLAEDPIIKAGLELGGKIGTVQ